MLVQYQYRDGVMSNDVAVGTFGSRTSGYLAGTCTVRGVATSSAFRPDGFSLWQVVGDLEAGAELQWGSDHGDEALYVVDGCLEVDGTPCPAGGAVVVESSVAAVVRAVTSTRVVHSGTVAAVAPVDGPFGPPASEGRGVHVIPAVDESRQIRAVGRPIVNSFFTDGTCPTCRIAYFLVDGRDATDGYVGRSHLHSKDEILHVLDGEVRVGQVSIGAGESIAIPANRRYGFRTPEGFRFLNYRGDAATATFAPGSTPILETLEALTASGIVTSV